MAQIDGPYLQPTQQVEIQSEPSFQLKVNTFIKNDDSSSVRDQIMINNDILNVSPAFFYPNKTKSSVITCLPVTSMCGYIVLDLSVISIVEQYLQEPVLVWVHLLLVPV